NDPARATAQEGSFRQEIETLKADRGQRPDEARTEDQPPRENTQVVARFESGTGTVAVHAKQTVTDHHMAIDVHAATPATGTSKSRNELSVSFAAAKDTTAQVLGESARTFMAETESVVYKGRIIGETDLHILQRISGRTAIAHMKRLFDSVPSV